MPLSSGFLKSVSRMGLSAKIYLFVFLALAGVLVITMQASVISRSNLEESKVKELKHLADLAVSVIEQQYNRVQQGQMSDEEGRDAALRELEKLRYDGNGYFVMLNGKGIVIGHGPKPALIGKNMWNVKDANGVAFTKLMVETAQQNAAGGIVKHLFPKPGSDVPVAKMNYSKQFKPWDIVVGAGTYVDDLEATYWSNMVSLLTSSAVIVAIVGVISFITALSIVRPMKAITGSMNELSNGELDVKIEFMDRTDEIGDMSRALRVFRDNARERAKLTEDQIRQKSESEAHQRKLLLDMADQFDDRVRNILDGVKHSVAKLSDETDSMANRARENTNRVEMISKAMDVSTTNVSNVAGASEEMTVSLTEIATQVDLSSNVSKTAVDEVKKGNGSCRNP